MIRRTDGQVFLWLGWWVDDLELGERHFHGEETKPFAPSPESVASALNTALETVLAWRPEILTEAGPISHAGGDETFYPQLRGP